MKTTCRVPDERSKDVRKSGFGVYKVRLVVMWTARRGARPKDENAEPLVDCFTNSLRFLPTDCFNLMSSVTRINVFN